ncbi:hypothetical protein T484DRAFT_1900777 [Baffinella frigidus]|nr:hypothetical protein T484DRAFT_1900777 [Cryptophyta sp. CCMP2293]
MPKKNKGKAKAAAAAAPAKEDEPQAVEQEPDAAPVEAAPVESAPVEVAPEEAAAVEEQPEAEEPVAESKKVWEPSRTDWQDPAGASPAAGKAVSPEELKEATRDVDVSEKKGSFAGSNSGGGSDEAAEASRGLEDKLGKLKDQLLTLRTAIKSFETDFDARLDACLQQIVSHKADFEADGTTA